MEGKIKSKKKYNDKKEAICVDGFDFKDSTEEKHLIAFENNTTSRCVFAKVSRKISRYHLNTEKNIRRIRWFASAIMESKPHINRGKKCDSINDGYAIMGMRPERLISVNGEYVYKKSVSTTRIDKLEETAFHIVNHLQLSMNHIKKYIEEDSDIMDEIINTLTLESIGRHATAFSIGLNYHSRCHTDVDMFYTLATVIAPMGISVDEVIYYFIFPTLRIMIPLKSGDSFMFNPLLPHSCSNPRYPGCHIMSAYVSRKTILRSKHL